MSGKETHCPRIYTAGAMRNDGEYEEWRRSIENSIEDLTFYHPEGFKHEHSGFNVNGAVSEDVAGIRASDGLVAYINKSPQIGTVTEVLHAVHNDTPTLVLFEEWEAGEGVISGMVSGNEEDYEMQKLKYPVEIKPITIRGHSSDFWFLINYLIGDTALENADTTMRGDPDSSLPGKIKRWGGCRNATVMAIPDDEHIQAAVSKWIESEFGIDTATSVI